MPRFLNQRNTDPWDMFNQGLLSGFAKGQELKQDAQDANALVDMYTSGNKILDMNYPANPQQQPGLFNTNPDITKPLTNQTTNQQPTGLFGNISLDKPINTTGNATTLAQPITPDNAPISKPDIAPQVQQPQRPPTLQEQVSYYKQQLPAMIKNYFSQQPGGKPKNAAEVKQAYDYFSQQINNKVADVTDKYNRQLQEDAYAVLGSNADYRTKLVTGIKAGMKPELLKLALDNGMTFHNLNLNDRQQPVAYDKHSNTVINLLTGQPITAEELRNGVNPTAIYNKNTVGADTIYKVNNMPVRGGGGGRNSNGLTATQQMARDDKLANAKAIMAAYNDGGEMSIDKDGNQVWKPYSTSEQIKFNQAADYIKAHDPTYGVTQEQPQSANNDDSGANWYYQTANEIKAAHPDATDDEIEAFMTKMINGG